MDYLDPSKSELRIALNPALLKMYTISLQATETTK